MANSTPSHSTPNPSDDLRRKAEDRVRQAIVDQPEDMAEPAIRAMVHELQVHQVELEMQNEELQKARTRAEEASERYYDLFDFAPIGYFVWDQGGRILEVNLAGAAMLGLDRIAASQKRFAQFVASDFRDAFADFLARVLATDTKQTCELRLLKDGQAVDVLVEGAVARDGQTQRNVCRAAVIDVTERKQAEDVVRFLARCGESGSGEQFFRKLARYLAQTLNMDFVSINRLTEDLLSAETLAIFHNGQFQDNVSCTLKDTPGGDAVGKDICHFPREVRGQFPKDGMLQALRAESYLGATLWNAQGKPIGLIAVIGRQPLADARRVELLLRMVAARAAGELERQQSEQALVAARSIAEIANVSKSQFLANMSHELRTPMNAILGMINVVLPKTVDPTAKDCLQTAKESADLLLTLLNDLLDTAKIESGKLELESTPFSPRRMLDQITRALSVRASEKGLQFFCRVQDEAPDAVIGDRTRLRQVLLNLAGNAIKFTERGEVEIRLNVLSREGEARLEFAVRDTGIGIPPSSLASLFQPFVQADASMTRRFGGTGLGLSISKTLVELMGGRIWVESELGHGSTFYFTVRLPLAKELSADVDAPLTGRPEACAPLRILLVEDNPANQKLATYILQDRGHLVDIATDGEEAVNLTKQTRYDVILMDVQMPGMNGLDATAAIRKSEDGSGRVPIIAMTAHAMRGDRDRCVAAGMDGYLSKPINAQEMLGLIESLAAGASPVSRDAPATPGRDEPPFRANAVVFDPEEARTRCFNSQDMLCEMIQYFFEEMSSMLPQMRIALEKGDLEEVGRLGHRLKGTLVYLV